MSDAVIKEEQPSVDGSMVAKEADLVEAGQPDEAKPPVAEASACQPEEEQEACVLINNPPAPEADGKDHNQQQDQGQSERHNEEGDAKKEGDSEPTGTTDIKDTKGDDKEDAGDKVEHKTDDKEANVSIGAQEVSSTIKSGDDRPSKIEQSIHRSSRRPSYNANRHHQYATGYQNYGLAYLPYKSNFEPSENARRRADEFFKTLKL